MRFGAFLPTLRLSLVADLEPEVDEDTRVYSQLRELGSNEGLKPDFESELDT